MAYVVSYFIFIFGLNFKTKNGPEGWNVSYALINLKTLAINDRFLIFLKRNRHRRNFNLTHPNSMSSKSLQSIYDKIFATLFIENINIFHRFVYNNKISDDLHANLLAKR